MTVTDDDGGTQTKTFKVTVANVAPKILTLTATVVPIAVNTPASATVTFDDPGVLDSATVKWTWDDGSTSSTPVAKQSGTRTVTATHSYSDAGVYQITVTVTDKDLDSDSKTLDSYIVVYDPDGGFVTGGGWINSPAGAYRWNTGLTGKATFGFVSKYLKGANAPTGNTEFQFHAAGMNFSSTSYEWLVVAVMKAMYKGVGTISGRPGTYGFMLSAVDNGSGGDTFRIKITENATGSLVYDNQLGLADDQYPTMTIEGGSIVVHSSTKK